jgi:salicylate hydroxylase
MGASDLRVAVIGAGIGGLSFGLALRERGVAADVFEQAPAAVRPLLRWYRGRVVLIGDAAHGMLPHPGQGANTSIEDAFTLAALLADARPGDLEPAFQRYQQMRRARTRKIQRSSWVTNALLHLRAGPAVAARDATVVRVPDEFGWIHSYDASRALAAAAVQAGERRAG